MKLSITCLVIFFCHQTLFAQPKEKNNPKDKTIFFEDFSSDKPDRSKWNVVVSNGNDVVNNEQQAYVDSGAVIYIDKNVAGAKNGALVIEPKFSPAYVTKSNKTFSFISGRINTRSKFEFTYGTASARIKMPAGSGLWPAFWLLGNGPWPATGEIDIMEFTGEKEWVSAALHGPGYSGETPFVNRFYFSKNFDASNWHVYAVQWEKDSISFTVDGMLYYRVTKTMAEHYGRWAFDQPKYIILNFALGGAYPAKINGIRSPYSGMTDESIQAVKEGRSKFLVDWVRVVQR